MCWHSKVRLGPEPNWPTGVRIRVSMVRVRLMVSSVLKLTWSRLWAGPDFRHSQICLCRIWRLCQAVMPNLCWRCRGRTAACQWWAAGLHSRRLQLPKLCWKRWRRHSRLGRVVCTTIRQPVMSATYQIRTCRLWLPGLRYRYFSFVWICRKIVTWHHNGTCIWFRIVEIAGIFYNNNDNNNNNNNNN